MQTQRRLASAVLAIGMTTVAAHAQSVISAHSGTLHYFEGAVTIDGQEVQSKVGKFSEIKENAVLRTGQGRAEVLLTPGVFIRVGENSQMKMLDNRLASTRVELLSGSAMVESDDPEISVKNPAVTILYKDYELQPVKFGLFEINAETGQLKVFKGQANVAAGGNRTVVKEGRLMPFSAALLTEKFDEKQGDDLYLWTRDRSAYISAANMSSAHTLASNGYGMNGLLQGYGSGYDAMGMGMNRFGGGWYYNPYLSMFTYMPYGGSAMSPFGYGFYSPFTILNYYSPSQYYWNGGGSARAASSTGVPLANLGAPSAAGQVSRFGSGISTHPTLGAPVRTVTTGGAVPSYRGPGNRGGFDSSAPAATRPVVSSSDMSSSPAASASRAPAGGGGGGFSGGGGGGGHAAGGGRAR